ncbi:MAG TPA: dipeptidase PepE, partial [Burkholderiaceae bacterium]|nr:dipeptidase PepE [Burkholderiaceae bacterium]
GYLVHARDAIAEIAAGAGHAAFIPFAGVTVSWDDYEARVAQALAPLGLQVRSLHRDADPAAALAASRLVLVGGGNTFSLLHHCRRRGLLDALRLQVAQGLRYVGWSAGTNLACPTIRTTNDMPVIDPGGFDALSLVPFQVNPHYTNATIPGHRGESRDQRLAEFLALNPQVPVLALPEGCWLRISGERMQLAGTQPAWWFRADGAPVRLPSGPIASI